LPSQLQLRNIIVRKHDASKQMHQVQTISEDAL